MRINRYRYLIYHYVGNICFCAQRTKVQFLITVLIKICKHFRLIRSDAHEMFDDCGKREGREVPCQTAVLYSPDIVYRQKGRKPHTLRCHAMNS